MTHTRFLPLILGVSSVTDQIYSRFLKLWASMYNSSNSRVKLIADMGLNCSRSIIGSNFYTISKRLGIEANEVKKCGFGMLKQRYMLECTEQDLTAVSLIFELRGFSKKIFEIDSFNKDEIGIMLDCICIE